MAAQWSQKCTLQNFGTFSTPTFGGIGEPFFDGRQRDTRTTGRQFSTNSQKQGQTGDNWNRNNGRRVEFKRIYEGEKYVDPHKHERMHQAQERQRNLTTNGFKYSSPNAKSSGLGGYSGTIGPKFAHVCEYDVLRKEDKPGEVQHELRQVLTNPGKLGIGASTPGTIFGPGPAKGEIPRTGREYVHAIDPYDLARQAERQERKFNMEAIAGRPAFKTVSHSVDFFDGKRTVAASAVYTEEPRMPERPAAPKEEPISGAAFYPARAPKSGPLGTFMKFPEYKEDPLEEKLKAAKLAAADARISTVPFKPTSKPKSSPSKSIIFRNGL